MMRDVNQNSLESLVNNNLRVVRESIYDTMTVAAASVMGTRTLLFGDPANSGKGATYPELTNMYDIGKLTFPQEHIVYSIRCVFIDMLSADVQAISKKFVGRLWVRGTLRATVPFTLTETPKIVTTIASDIVVQAEASLDLPDDYPINISAGEPFFFEVTGSTAYTLTTTNGRGLTLRVQLEGFHGYPL